MTPSPRCAALIQSFERCFEPVPGRPGWFRAYLPTKRDRWTCGWGNTDGVTRDTVWSQDECDTNFEHVLASFGAGVTQELGGCPTTQNQFDALCSFAYNVGLDNDHDGIAEGLGDSTLLRLHKAGDYAGAAAQFAKWDKQAGVVLGGLVRRRAAEAALYQEQ